MALKKTVNMNIFLRLSGFPSSFSVGVNFAV